MLEVCRAATWKVLETMWHRGRVCKRKTPSENPNRSTNLGYYFFFGIGLEESCVQKEHVALLLLQQ